METQTPLTQIVVHGLTNTENNLQGRCNLVKEHIITELKNRYKRIYKRIITTNAKNLDSQNRIGVIQLMLVAPTSLLVSVSSTMQGNTGWELPLPWEFGQPPTPATSKLPPSRAYVKLDQIIALFGRQPKSGELVADLGSAPGGWTYRLAVDLVRFIYLAYLLYFLLFSSIAK